MGQIGFSDLVPYILIQAGGNFQLLKQWHLLTTKDHRSLRKKCLYVTLSASSRPQPQPARHHRQRERELLSLDIFVCHFILWMHFRMLGVLHRQVIQCWMLLLLTFLVLFILSFLSSFFLPLLFILFSVFLPLFFSVFSLQSQQYSHPQFVPQPIPKILTGALKHLPLFLSIPVLFVHFHIAHHTWWNYLIYSTKEKACLYSIETLQWYLTCTLVTIGLNFSFWPLPWQCFTFPRVCVCKFVAPGVWVCATKIKRGSAEIIVFFPAGKKRVDGK